MSLQYKLAMLFPKLGKIKRKLTAFRHAQLSVKESYAQTGEDREVKQLLEKYYPNEQWFYIDIGANHPSDISNTYLLYRHGARGVTIEPFSELADLHKQYRPDDIVLPVGCSKENSIAEIFISKTPVLSSLHKEEAGEVWKTEYIPVYKLDTIVEALKIDKIHFLSIDVEGLDLEVLKGSIESLKKVSFVCVEGNTPQIQEELSAFLIKQNFTLTKKIHCNLIFQNKLIIT